jgi:hypothetical protein
MRAGLVALLAVAPALTGCLVIRAGGGATLETSRDALGRREGPGRYDTELGVMYPVEGRSGRWILSVLGARRGPDSEELGRALLVLEAARPLFVPPEGSPNGEDPFGWSLPAGWRDYGLRLELGGSGRGGYFGGAAKATLRLHVRWTLTGLVTAGYKTGPDHGPSGGLHLLAGWN